MPKRAPALAPDDRRAAIIAAALPLLLERGAGVTTRQIAEAAGVAEGTIFGVFADKDALISAVVEAALDREPAERALAAIDRSLPFEAQLVAAVRVMQERLMDIWRLVASVGDRHITPRPHADFTGLIEIFEAERGRLRTTPTLAARELRALTLAVTHPVMFPDAPMSPPEIVALLLHGIGDHSPCQFHEALPR